LPNIVYLVLIRLVANFNVPGVCSSVRSSTRSPVRRQHLSPPRFVTKNFKLFAPRLNMNRQQDAHEFLRLVVDALQSAERSKSGTVVERIWGGKLRSRVQCSHCHGTSDTFEPLLDLSLELKGGSLDTALRHFCKTERLAGANAYRCERCKSLQAATKRLTIDEPPNALVVHLKRFQFSLRSGMKLNQMVEYGETLDLAPYISTPSAACRYRLTGVVVHSGSSMGSGHYYAFVRSGAGTWHQIDDSMVQTTSLQKALSQQSIHFIFCQTSRGKEKSRTTNTRSTSATTTTTTTTTNNTNTMNNNNTSDFADNVSVHRQQHLSIKRHLLQNANGRLAISNSQRRLVSNAKQPQHF
jgi:ubiquitin C-terminal hydrolase